MVRRGERSLRRHLGEETKLRGCLRTHREAVGNYISNSQGVM